METSKLPICLPCLRFNKWRVHCHISLKMKIHFQWPQMQLRFNPNSNNNRSNHSRELNLPLLTQPAIWMSWKIYFRKSKKFLQKFPNNLFLKIKEKLKDFFGQIGTIFLISQQLVPRISRFLRINRFPKIHSQVWANCHQWSPSSKIS